MMRPIGRAVGRAVGYAGRTFRSRENRERILLGVGLGSLACSFLVVFVPWAVPESVVKPAVGWIADPTTIFLLAVAGGLVALWSLKGGVTEEREDVWRPRIEPERAHFDEHRTSGSAVDDGLGLAGNIGMKARERRTRRSTTRRHVRIAAVETLRSEGYAESEATAQLEDGSWTDDPRAAAFLGASNATVPLRTRISDWARGETFDKRVERTVAELQARNGGRSR